MIGDNTVPITTNKDSIPSNKANLVALLSGFETSAPQAYIPEKKTNLGNILKVPYEIVIWQYLLRYHTGIPPNRPYNVSMKKNSNGNCSMKAKLIIIPISPIS